MRKEEYSMKGSKLFKNVRLKGQKERVSILVKDGIFKKIAADIPQEETVGCEEVDLNGQLVVPPYVDPHLHLDYVFTANVIQFYFVMKVHQAPKTFFYLLEHDCDDFQYLP